jgi:hypothetical protein
VKSLSISFLVEIILLISLSAAAQASNPPARLSFASLFKIGAQVLDVRILSSDLVQCVDDKKAIECGARYTARVNESFKGAAKEHDLVDFSAWDGLKTGERYIVFLHSRLPDLGEGSESEGIRNRYCCEEALPALSTQVYYLEFVKSSLKPAAAWLEIDYFRFKIPAGLDVRKDGHAVCEDPVSLEEMSSRDERCAPYRTRSLIAWKDLREILTRLRSDHETTETGATVDEAETGATHP